MHILLRVSLGFVSALTLLLGIWFVLAELNLVDVHGHWLDFLRPFRWSIMIGWVAWSVVAGFTFLGLLLNAKREGTVLNALVLCFVAAVILTLTTAALSERLHQYSKDQQAFTALFLYLSLSSSLGFLVIATEPLWHRKKPAESGHSAVIY